MMKIAIGSDHRGLQQRQVVASAIELLGHEVDDRGSFSEESCDYPDIALDVSQRVAHGDADRGILICGTGIGMSIAANKVHGIRAALANSVEAAELSRQHNDANVLCLAGNHFDAENARQIVSAWLTTDFEGGRHARRVAKIAEIEAAAQKAV